MKEVDGVDHYALVAYVDRGREREPAAVARFVRCPGTSVPRRLRGYRDRPLAKPWCGKLLLKRLFAAAKRRGHILAYNDPMLRLLRPYVERGHRDVLEVEFPI